MINKKELEPIFIRYYYIQYIDDDGWSDDNMENFDQGRLNQVCYGLKIFHPIFLFVIIAFLILTTAEQGISPIKKC